MGDPYARLRAHVARGLEQKGEIKDEVEEPAVKIHKQPRRPRPDGDNWLQLGWAVIKPMQLPPAVREEAAQEAALAGWLAAEKWSPTGGMSRRNWIWQQARRGVFDFLRLRLGRSGKRAAWEDSVRYLDELIADDTDSTRGDFVSIMDDDYARIEEGLDLCRLIRTAGLDDREHEIVVAFLVEERLKATGARWGVSEARACQVRSVAFEKLRSAA